MFEANVETYAAVSFYSQPKVVSTSVVARLEVPPCPPTTKALRGEWACGSANATHPRRTVSIAGPAAKYIVWRERASVVSIEAWPSYSCSH